MVLHHSRNHLISNTSFPLAFIFLFCLELQRYLRDKWVWMLRGMKEAKSCHKDSVALLSSQDACTGISPFSRCFLGKQKDPRSVLQKWMTEERLLPHLRTEIALSNYRYAFGLESMRCKRTSKVTQYERENRPNPQARKINEKASSNFNGANFISCFHVWFVNDVIVKSQLVFFLECSYILHLTCKLLLEPCIKYL